jgi:hypothetical protein
VSFDESSASAGQLSLAVWFRGRPDFVDLGPEASRVGTMLTFKISARRLLHDEFDSSDAVLLLQAERKGTIMAASPIMIPGDSIPPTASRPEEMRNGRIQVGATPRGSIIVTVKRPRRLPVWHRPRLAG